MVAIDALPGAPRGVEGVVDVRGEVLPVIDVRQRLGLAHRPPAVTDHLVIARTPERTVALRVDRAVSFETRDMTDVRPVEAGQPTAEHVKGVARTADGLLVIVDIAAFLSGEESEALATALAKATDA